jgi:predicted ATPase
VGGRRNSTRILGRERELAVLADALEGLDEGTPSVVLVSGSAGVGKTRLVDEFVLRAEKIRAVRGGCVDMASPGAYAPWTEILWWLFGGLDDDQLETVVAGNRPHVARLLPALGSARA